MLARDRYQCIKLIDEASYWNEYEDLVEYLNYWYDIEPGDFTDPDEWFEEVIKRYNAECDEYGGKKYV